MKTYTPNLGIVEICLTYRCNVKCDNCSNLCTQAPLGAEGDLTVDDIERMIRESVDTKWPWGLFTLHGGEPSLHPDIITIAHILVEYRKRWNNGLQMQILTNWSSEKIRETCRQLQAMGINSGISEKRERNMMSNGSPIPYVPVNESPVDLGLEPECGCFQTENCGLCYNYLGWWECSPSAAAARVFNYAPVSRSLTGLTREALSEALKTHCRHCGFSRPERPRTIEQKTTQTWRAAFDEYARVKHDRR